MADGVRSDGYYRWFPGDYLRDTGDLSMTEDGAYRRLLDHYYSEEKLSCDPQRLYRICRASTAAERSAVDFVVGRFFQKEDGCLINSRTERELVARRTFLEEQTRKAKLGAKARWEEKKYSRKIPKGMPGALPGALPGGMPGRCPDDAQASASASGSALEPKDLRQHPSTASKKLAAVASWENGLIRVREVLEELQVLETDLNDPAYWKRLNAWSESSGQKIYILDDLRAYIAWWSVQAGAKRHKKLAKGFRNWLASTIRRKENDALREAARNSSRK